MLKESAKMVAGISLPKTVELVHKTNLFFVEPLDDLSRLILSSFVPESEACPGMICADLEPHDL